ncbi:MAG: hypothetical protein NXI10_17665, partial [bacterium]|nr:hypothetical protein [bacterium]
MSAHTTNSVFCARSIVALLLVVPLLTMGLGCSSGTNNDQKTKKKQEEQERQEKKRLVYELFTQLSELGEAAKAEIQDPKDTVAQTINNSEQKMQVFGWHADYIRTAYQEYNFDLLTSLAYHSCKLEMQYGEPAIDSSDWSSSARRSLSHEANEHSCNFLVTLSSIDESAIIRTLENETWRNKCIEDVGNIVRGSPYIEGLAISFE